RPADDDGGFCSRAPGLLRRDRGLSLNAISLGSSALTWRPLTSFRRKPESSLFALFWTPAFAGVTVWAAKFVLS
ncbi:MAG: hypothetical protein ABII06_00595, partial [Pseudomonadota bacterium]